MGGARGTIISCWWKHNAACWGGHRLVPLCVFFKLLWTDPHDLIGLEGMAGGGLFMSLFTKCLLGTGSMTGLPDIMQGRSHIKISSQMRSSLGPRGRLVASSGWAGKGGDGREGEGEKSLLNFMSPSPQPNSPFSSRSNWGSWWNTRNFLELRSSCCVHSQRVPWSGLGWV